MPKNLVIIADDDAATREVLAEIIEQEGLKQLNFKNGKLALEALESHPDDIILVISDIQMPEMNGIQFLRQARKSFPETPFVIASGYGTKNDIITALKLGVLDYLEKPFRVKDVREITQKIKQAISETQQEAKLYHYLEDKKICFKISNDIKLVHSLVNELIREIKKIGGKSLQPEITGIRMALHEAVVNAIEHGNLELSSTLKEKPDYMEILEKRMAESPYSTRQVLVATTVTPTSFSCEITDEGPGFDWQSLPDPRDPENLFKPHGRGIILMANYFDRVRFNEQGNSIIMEKDFDPEAATP
ncbi:MAG: response regulator [Xanthomonadaceae bacterium]|nr:response regulator [Xanthomonadaceae bacterium]